MFNLRYKAMNWKEEVIEIINGALKKDSKEDALKYVLKSIIEVSDIAVNISELRQLMQDLIEEIECPEETKQQDDPIIEIHSSGVLDS